MDPKSDPAAVHRAICIPAPSAFLETHGNVLARIGIFLALGLLPEIRLLNKYC